MAKFWYPQVIKILIRYKLRYKSIMIINRIFIFIFICIFCRPFAPLSAGVSESRSASNVIDSMESTNKNFYITPYAGESTLVGNFGIEFQYKNTGYNIGIFKDVIAVDNTLCGGVRYYFNPQDNSGVIGLGGGIALDQPQADEALCKDDDNDIPHGFCETGSVLDRYLGITLGYRWVWWHKLRIMIGAGPNFIRWKKIMVGTKEGTNPKYLPMLDFVIGYTF